MGKANFGIALANRNEPVVAGSHLKGQVWADIKSEIKGTQMQVQLIGAEKTAIRYTSGSGQQATTRTAHAQRSLIQAALPVNHLQMIQNGKIPVGRYKMPFDIELPDVLPSSMSVVSGGNSCTVVYTIKAILKGSGMIYDYNCQRVIAIKAQPMERAVQPFEGQPSTVQVNLCGCMNRGNMTVGAHMEDTILDKGKTANLSLSCRNHTTVRVQRVEAMLWENTVWQAGGHCHATTKILQKMDFGTQGLERKTQLVPRGQSLRNDQLEMLQELRTATNAHMVTMPTHALNTYASQLMSVSHEVHIRVVTNYCIDNPELRIPIRTGESGPMSAVAMAHPAPSAPIEIMTASGIIPPNFESAVQSSVVYVPSGQVYTGGAAMEGEDEDFIIPAVAETVGPSMAVLFKEMNDSVADLDIVRRRIADPAWKSVMQGITPSNYGKMIKLVDLDFDQPKVALAVALQIPNFTCEYTVAAVKGASEWNRSTIVEKLIPLNKDLAANKDIILLELSDWDQTVTERAFQKALLRRT